MKLSDYVFDFLSELGISHVFMIVGAANSHLADSLAKHGKIRFVCPQHEQAAAMAAEGYARSSGKLGAALVTSGPGGTNTITGVCGAWCDSIPCIFISGQLPSSLIAKKNTVRQLGVQQINIVNLVEPITKYSAMVKKGEDIRYHLERAVYEATIGRSGPVWLDIPTEIQRAEVEPGKLRQFIPPKDISPKPIDELRKIKKVMELISGAKRPVIIGGHGIRLAGAQNEFRELVEKLRFPVILTWNGIDLIEHCHPLFIGSAGVMGQRGPNFAVANSDLIFSIGSRLDTRQVGNSPELYARHAKKIVVDVSAHELQKELIKIDLPVHLDAKLFIEKFLECVPNVKDVGPWLKRCQEWHRKYPMVLPRYYHENNGVNSYVFIDALSCLLEKGDIIVTDMGTSLTCTMQTFKIKAGQRLFTSMGLASMGYGLPGAIGAWYGADQPQRIIGIFGDGGFQMNIQELQTIAHYKVPIKIFLLNNKSYLTIKHTQEMFFDGRYAGSEFGSGYSTPDFTKVAAAYGLQTFPIVSQEELKEKIETVLNMPGPVLCEIQMPEDQPLTPLSVLDRSKGYAGSPIERMYPFLPEDEFLENMIVPAV